VRLNRAVPLEMMLLVACGLLACAPPHAVSRTPEVVVLSDASAGSPPSTSTPGPQGAADGARCDRAGECKSGNCVDHVCCESACAGTCLACDRPGAEGQCLPVPEGQDPDNECAEEPVSTCGRDGVCDGHGACRRQKAGTECGPGGCTVATETAASTCDGNGVCQPGASKSCAPAVCIESSCGSPCAKDGDCQTGFFCDNSTCRITRPQGDACDRDTQCSTAHCADKVCCGTACTDKCYACDLMGSMGTCTAVGDGQDPHAECPVQNIFTCGNAGGCNGRGACRQHLAGTQCTAGTTCSGSTLTAVHACDGKGKCLPGPRSDCSPFSCNGGLVCWTACSTNAECKAPRTCRIDHTCQ
jgi:hypothetical protein